MNHYLEKYSFPVDLKQMEYDELELLSYEIRDFLVEQVSKSGGHLSSNLGVVELAIALHRTFNTPEDKLIWDVGHQTYVHKILTGRLKGFENLRQYGGMSGFPKTSESVYDLFDTGHSSTSISLGLGMAAARDIAGDDYNVISVIGDGALTGGLAFEALNNTSMLKTKFIVILNDNGMSISPNTGGLSKYLDRLRSSSEYIKLKAGIKKNISKIPVVGDTIVAGIQHARDSIKYAMIDGIIFEELGFRYSGPIDGHNIREMCEAVELAKRSDEPVMLHVITKKGKGYTKAEKNPNLFHGIGPFDADTGQLLKKSSKRSYSEVFGNKLIDMAEKDSKIVAVSAAMIEGTGLEKFSRKYPKRIFDVGIAEGHAVTFASGMAKAGLKPFVAIYSTFLQRAYDQIVEDVCLQRLPVIFCIDRAGIVGADGETHHGIFDISYLKHIPGLTVMSPEDDSEFEAMMEYAVALEAPCAIRYPRGTASHIGRNVELKYGESYRIKNGKELDIWALGTMVPKAVEVADILSKNGINAGVVNMRFVKPLDVRQLINAGETFSLIVTLEDNVVSGGIGEEIAATLAVNSKRTPEILNIGWPDKFIEHGTCEELYEKYGMNAEAIAERIIKKLERQT